MGYESEEAGHTLSLCNLYILIYVPKLAMSTSQKSKSTPSLLVSWSTDMIAYSIDRFLFGEASGSSFFKVTFVGADGNNCKTHM